LKERKDKKFQRWLLAEKTPKVNQSNPNHPQQFYPRLINNSSTELTEDEEKLLSFGLKHTIPLLSERGIRDRIVADLICTTTKYQTDTCDRLSNIIHDNPIPTANQRLKSTVLQLVKKTRQGGTIITKADKGSSVVLMDGWEYTCKMTTCLGSIGATIDPSFDFGTYNEDVRKEIGKSKYILDKEPLKNAVLVMNPQAPRLYGLPKIHKEGSPMRPVVSFISSPTYKLAKYLDTWFKSVSNFHPPFSKNSVELCNVLTEAPTPPSWKYCHFFRCFGTFSPCPSYTHV